MDYFTKNAQFLFDSFFLTMFQNSEKSLCFIPTIDNYGKLLVFWPCQFRLTSGSMKAVSGGGGGVGW